MDEQMLLTGPLEPTNQCYAVAKIAGIKLVEAFRQQYGADFICVMPTNPVVTRVIFRGVDCFDPGGQRVGAI
jgi:nucleoside-diphosphate-sugar epimerase